MSAIYLVALIYATTEVYSMTGLVALARLQTQPFTFCATLYHTNLSSCASSERAWTRRFGHLGFKKGGSVIKG